MKGTSPGDERRKVLWLGSKPDPAVAAEFANRKFVIDICEESAMALEFRVSTAIVLRFDASDADSFNSRLNGLVVSAINHGLLVTAWADSDGAFLSMNELLKKAPCNA